MYNMYNMTKMCNMCNITALQQSIRRARPNHFCGGNGQICEELFDCRAFHTEITTPPRVCAVLYQEHIDDCHSNKKQKTCYSGVTIVNKIIISYFTGHITSNSYTRSDAYNLLLLASSPGHLASFYSDKFVCKDECLQTITL